MQRRKGQFAGKANPQEGASASTSGDPSQSMNQDQPQDNKLVFVIVFLLKVLVHGYLKIKLLPIDNLGPGLSSFLIPAEFCSFLQFFSLDVKTVALVRS